ncbi:hypothetical protein AY600_07455 [Phormidium willei BDU 130791]|nr:hypothetical protein AY600_07455 [Phormidium willei BDU 130791]
MGQALQGKTIGYWRSLIDSCLDSHVISHQDYLKLTCLLLSGQGLSAEDYQQINAIFDRIQLGRIQIVYT